MTAAFFAPESYYSENVRNIVFNEWSSSDAKAVNDFKDMVSAFHKNDIAVIMDVVYNHLSEYEFGNLKEIDKDYYFRLNPDGSYCAVSGCGNDLRTEAPMLRKLIVESVLYWMKEYHVDGFRFDLGKMLDWQTIETIVYEAKKNNPDVVFWRIKCPSAVDTKQRTVWIYFRYKFLIFFNSAVKFIWNIRSNRVSLQPP